jgi:FlaA1/EpsC-like NDP-sugar epimerase
VTRTVTKFVATLARRLSLLPRSDKRLVMFGADLVGIPAALWTAISLQIGTVDHRGIDGDGWLYGLALAATLPIFTRLGLYRAVVRFLGSQALNAVLVGVTVSVALVLVADLAVVKSGLPPTVFGIYWALAMIYVGGGRLLARSMLDRRRHGTERVAIYGAGSAGARLAFVLMHAGRYVPVVFVDDNPTLHGSTVHGIEVRGPEELESLISEHSIKAVLLALPSLSRWRRQAILARLAPLSVHVQTVPDVGDIVSGRATIEDLRDVDVADLLGRDPVPPNEGLLGACIAGKVVMVTGAGGSIGSELCRQILRLGPARLVLFEMSELALYSIEKELRYFADREKLTVDVVALLGNAHHRMRVREVLQSYGVQTVYHAAAYKHVPIVEQNVVEGVHNNVIGTWYAAEAALQCRVETFVLVSTDKAVNPTNVMGATKRLAEIVLQALQTRSSYTRFCMVRFGNVLESSGSVVPLFREQIRRGGPLTVTHKNVIRYFMTIPEAAQLVLQAGAMAKGGDVFVLDMGKPVRIDDLARRMINLMGLTVREEGSHEGDIEIVYTGLRPAEKLFEELLIGSNVTGTAHSRILRAIEHSLPWPTVQQTLEEMLQCLDRSDCRRIRELLIQSVAEYKPQLGIQDLIWARTQVAGGGGGASAAEPAKVADLHAHRARQPRGPQSLAPPPPVD